MKVIFSNCETGKKNQGFILFALLPENDYKDGKGSFVFTRGKIGLKKLSSQGKLSPFLILPGSPVGFLYRFCYCQSFPPPPYWRADSSIIKLSSLFHSFPFLGLVAGSFRKGGPIQVNYFLFLKVQDSLFKLSFCAFGRCTFRSSICPRSPKAFETVLI